MIFRLSCLWLVATLLVGCGPSLVELDNEQGRLDTATPIIVGSTTVGQTFVSRRKGLSAVEVLLVVYGETGAPGGQLVFHLRSAPGDATDLVTIARDTGSLTHNQPLRFTFDPLPDSEGRSYYFFLESSSDTRVGVWYNSVDAYGEGTLFLNGEPQPGDLQFKTYYAYDLGQMTRDAVQGLARHGSLVLPIVALVLIPGTVAWLWLWPMADELPGPAEQVALSAGLSLALWPLLLLYTTLLGVRMTGLLLAGLLALGVVVILWRLWRLKWQPLNAWRVRNAWPALGLFALLLGITLVVRFLQVRELVVPAWVDGLHHTMMAGLVVRAGGVPADYQPYLDIGPFIYHYGFHGLTAGLVWLTGLPVPQAVLVMGQVVNALVGVGLYLLAVRLTGRVVAGLVALGVVGTLSLMPAYYVSWGRYTQLMGLTVLPVAAVLTLEGLRKGGWQRLLLAGLSVAGLGVIHYRVLVFYAAFVLAALLVESVAHWRGGKAVWPLWGRTALLAGVSLLLLTPWLARLYGALVPTGRLWGWFRGRASFNAVPRELIDIGYDRPLLRLAILSGLLGLAWWRRVALLIALWVAGAVLAANPNLLGLRETRLLSNSSLVISLFFPVALLVGVLAAATVKAVLQRLAGARRTLAWVILAVVWLAVVIRGAWNMVDIVNPVTVIATRDDIAAMDWIRAHTPPEARFLTNVRIWQGRTYMGADGGYWIPVLTGRQTLVPPVLYSFGSAEAYYRVQNVLDVLAGVSGPEDPAFWQLVREQGIDYVYLGAHAGPLKPRMFVNRPDFDVVYSNGAVWIFRIKGQ